MVSFEGADYSGKTATSQYLANVLQSDGLNVVWNTGVVVKNPVSQRIALMAKNVSELEREALYTQDFFTDSVMCPNKKDDALVLQDRYWMSVVAYGRFLNNGKSLHELIDVRPLLYKPSAVVLLSCSYEEKLRRSEVRGNKSVFDAYVLGDKKKLEDLEDEIEYSIEGFEKVLRIDTTNIPMRDVAERVQDFLVQEGLLCELSMTHSA